MRTWALTVWLSLTVGCNSTQAKPKEISASDNGDSTLSELREESPAVFARLQIDPPPGSAGLSSDASVLDLAVLHIQTPADAHASLRTIWRHVREECVPSQTLMQLQRNGFRMGVGDADLWEPIRATLSEVAGNRVTLSQPVRVPKAFPLALELDAAARDQTLFCMEADGVLNGETWPDSRNVLRLTYTPDAGPAGLAHFEVVPEVRQRLKGLQYVRTEAGICEAPRQKTRTFDSLAVTLSLKPNEFVLIGPSDNAAVDGLLGGAFLTSEINGTQYYSYIVLRPEVRRVN